MISTLTTQFSTYELDQENSRIRRLVSTHTATRNQGNDGDWKPYWHVSMFGKQLLIEWGIDDGILRRTLTSEITAVEGEPLDIPTYTGTRTT